MAAVLDRRKIHSLPRYYTGNLLGVLYFLMYEMVLPCSIFYPILGSRF